MFDLALFYRPNCGYCLKVVRFIQENNIEIILKNINESSEIRDELITLTEKTQVPCLIVHGKPLYESDDIIDWLKQNWSKNDNS